MSPIQFSQPSLKLDLQDMFQLYSPNDKIVEREGWTGTGVDARQGRCKYMNMVFYLYK